MRRLPNRLASIARRKCRWTLPLIAVAAAGCSDASVEGDPETSAAAAYQQRIEEVPRRPVAPDLSAEERALDDAVFTTANVFEGYVGIAIRDIERGRVIHFNGERMFPQQSLSKLWVALAALEKVDEGELDLAEKVSIRRSDLTVFHQPVRKIVLARGAFHTDYGDLLRRAITESDNTANDMLLRRVGGPPGVRNAIAAGDLGAIKFGPGERAMQSALAGLEWDPSYSIGKRFFEVRKTVPAAQREIAFNGYVNDPVDGASPNAIAAALARLAQGDLLEPPTTDLFLRLLDAVKSGPNRLKGGVPEGWSIGHKTGTGQVLDTVPPGVIGEQAGYNDVGILTAPDGHRYAVVVMIGRTATPVPERMELMHRIVAATVAYHYQAKGEAVPPAMLPPIEES
ncbi:serine hydrolase [Parerythrobacter jejuensis]|uniref:beta-lactamase n=1 Tax=Parerythrobacter jejuensis TaxID=795812 RepID=A0A845AUS5_9SPHN|nr:serine hydrolase [Parerythrobacter jejuensis]MXP32561.1 serine hydrolase [Parerythrobacter jejuensis]